VRLWRSDRATPARSGNRARHRRVVSRARICASASPAGHGHHARLAGGVMGPCSRMRCQLLLTQLEPTPPLFTISSSSPQECLIPGRVAEPSPHHDVLEIARKLLIDFLAAARARGRPCETVPSMTLNAVQRFESGASPPTKNVSVPLTGGDFSTAVSEHPGSVFPRGAAISASSRLQGTGMVLWMQTMPPADRRRTARGPHPKARQLRLTCCSSKTRCRQSRTPVQVV